MCEGCHLNEAVMNIGWHLVCAECANDWAYERLLSGIFLLDPPTLETITQRKA